MKTTYIFITAFFALLSAGCASTYTSKDFYTKEGFYSDFNNSSCGKSVTITLNSDSSFISEGGTKIKHDSVYITNIYNLDKE